MDRKLLKTFLINATLVAQADGYVSAPEQDYIQEFMQRAAITRTQAHMWQAEARLNELDFLQINNPDSVLDLLKIMIGAAAADRMLTRGELERIRWVALGSGYPTEELRRMIEQNWKCDVLDEIFPCEPAPENHQNPDQHSEVTNQRPPEPLIAQEEKMDSNPQVLIYRDNMSDKKIGEIHQMNPGLNFENFALSDTIAVAREHALIIFHAAEERDTSLATLSRLMIQFASTPILVLMRRDQATQVSYLLAAGAKRCIVEPFRPNEIERYLKTAI